MGDWLRYGFLLLGIWTRRVGVWEALRGCAWVISRKVLPGRVALAKALMPQPRMLELEIPGHTHPFYARWPASDLHIVHTILTRKEYGPMAAHLDAETKIVLLDLGANIGAASRYFLETFPRARVIAVEPDAGNVAMCRMNLEPYGARARVVQAAIWSRNTRLVFVKETKETGTEAGIRVREPFPGEELSASIAAVDIPTLFSEAGVTPDSQVAMKIDVEGSEEEIFSSPNLEWLDGVSCIAIELHDRVRANCSENFLSAVEKRLLEPPMKRGDTVFVRLNSYPSHVVYSPV